MAISFNQRNRCPGCGGFAGAYKDEKRCRGFLHSDGEGFFCEHPNARNSVYNFSGYNLWYYKLEEGEK